MSTLLLGGSAATHRQHHSSAVSGVSEPTAAGTNPTRWQGSDASDTPAVQITSGAVWLTDPHRASAVDLFAD